MQYKKASTPELELESTEECYEETEDSHEEAPAPTPTPIPAKTKKEKGKKTSSKGSDKEKKQKGSATKKASTKGSTKGSTKASAKAEAEAKRKAELQAKINELSIPIIFQHEVDKDKIVSKIWQMLESGFELRTDVEALMKLRQYADECEFRTFSISPWKGELKPYEVRYLDIIFLFILLYLLRLGTGHLGKHWFRAYT